MLGKIGAQIGGKLAQPYMIAKQLVFYRQLFQFRTDFLIKAYLHSFIIVI